MNPSTYRVKPVKCPRCGETIPVLKVRNGGSIHLRRVRALARHVNESHREARP